MRTIGETRGDSSKPLISISGTEMAPATRSIGSHRLFASTWCWDWGCFYFRHRNFYFRLRNFYFRHLILFPSPKWRRRPGRLDPTDFSPRPGVGNGSFLFYAPKWCPFLFPAPKWCRVLFPALKWRLFYFRHRNGACDKVDRIPQALRLDLVGWCHQ